MGKQKDHNESEKRGARASGFDQVAEQFNPCRSEHNIKGFNHGVQNQPNKEGPDFIDEWGNTVIDLINPFSSNSDKTPATKKSSTTSSYFSDTSDYGDYRATPRKGQTQNTRDGIGRVLGWIIAAPVYAVIGFVVCVFVLAILSTIVMFIIGAILAMTGQMK